MFILRVVYKTKMTKANGAHLTEFDGKSYFNVYKVHTKHQKLLPILEQIDISLKKITN